MQRASFGLTPPPRAPRGPGPAPAAGWRQAAQKQIRITGALTLRLLGVRLPAPAIYRSCEPASISVARPVSAHWTGTAAMRRVPSPGAVSTVSDPPTSAIRSRTAFRPV